MTRMIFFGSNPLKIPKKNNSRTRDKQITRMITDRIGLYSVPLQILIKPITTLSFAFPYASGSWLIISFCFTCYFLWRVIKSKPELPQQNNLIKNHVTRSLRRLNLKTSKTARSENRGKTRTTESWFVSVLNLIGC